MSRPTPLRLAGFVLTVLGGLLVSYGSLQTWATTGLRNDRKGVFDSIYKGVDLLDGRVTLALGMFVLVSLVVMRLVGSVGVRRSLALAILVAGAAATTVGIIDLARAKERFSVSPGDLDRQAAAIARIGHVSVDLVRGELQRQYELQQVVDVGMGLYLVMGGGILATVGGGLGLVWVAQAARETGSPPEGRSSEERTTEAT